MPSLKPFISAAIISLLLAVSLPAELQTSPGITVDRNHWFPPGNGGLLSPMVAYAPNPGKTGYGDLVEIASLIVASDDFAAILQRRSSDNGKTWSPTAEVDLYDPSIMPEEDREHLRILADSIYTDERNHTMVLFVNYYSWKEGPDRHKKRKVVTFYSDDNGYTWDGPYHVTQKGKDRDGRKFDTLHWNEYTTYGQNLAGSGQVPIIRLQGDGPRKGHIILPLYIQKLTDSGELYTPTWYFLECATMIGKWRKDRLVWPAVSNKVGVTHEQSDRGVYEATVAELNDGRCLMLMRMSNHGGKVRGCKMISVSDDQCLTWSDPAPLTYDDGSWMYSSASNGFLLRHSSGRLFYCGIITQTNTDNNMPRYPVCVAEIDQDTLTVRKATVQIVATRRPGEPVDVQYVNHGIYEDRENGNLIVLCPNTNHEKMKQANIERYELPIALFDR